VPLPVSAVILSYNRRDRLERVLDELERLDVVDEVLVVDSSSDDTPAMVAARGGRVRLLANDDTGVAGRNVGALEARNELVLMLDDDSCPNPGAVERLAEAHRHNDRLGVATGLVRDVDDAGATLQSTELGSFDWFLRRGRAGAPSDGFDTFFFAEGACMVRRTPFLEAGGFFPPYFFTLSELDATMRLAADGWETRYFPDAGFDHFRPLVNKVPSARTLTLRTRNHQWHFWLRYPVRMAIPRMVFYGLFDLLEAVFRGHARAWWTGVTEAWRQRGDVAAHRRPLPARVLRRVEDGRAGLHIALLVGQVRRRLPFSR
jgi:GT2 family glycosyltransferase